MPALTSTRARIALLAAAVGFVPWPALGQDEIEEVVVLGTYLEDRSVQAETQITVGRAELESTA